MMKITTFRQIKKINMKSLRLLISFMLLSQLTFTQDMKNFKLYNPYENVDSALKIVLTQAKKENKHVFVQIGGNWCVWCARFNDFVAKDVKLDSAMNKNFIVYHMNYSPENRNPAVLKKFGYPQRFGFPVFVMLDAKGKRLHTQNSAYLEEGKSYSSRKILEFFDHWGPRALDAAQYKNY